MFDCALICSLWVLIETLQVQVELSRDLKRNLIYWKYTIYHPSMNMNSIPRGGEYLLKLTLLKNKQMNRQWVWMRQAANGKGVKCKGRQIMKAILVMIHDSSQVVKVVDIRYRHERIGMSTCSFVTQSNLKL